jgi:hypothetical protein
MNRLRRFPVPSPTLNHALKTKAHPRKATVAWHALEADKAIVAVAVVEDSIKGNAAVPRRDRICHLSNKFRNTNSARMAKHRNAIPGNLLPGQHN